MVLYFVFVKNVVLFYVVFFLMRFFCGHPLVVRKNVVENFGQIFCSLKKS